MNKDLIWNVFLEDVNGKSIIEYNIFDHYGFYSELIKIKKQFKKAYKDLKSSYKKQNKVMEVGSYMRWVNDYKDVFAESVKKSLMYYFWSKCEYEIVLTSWPVYIDKKEFDRIKQENSKYRLTINPVCGKKIDVYDQIMLNSDLFIDYVWANIDSIKERR